MQPFIFRNPTKVIFGKNAADRLPQELAAFGERVLLVYGGGSIKRTGLYDRLVRHLTQSGKKVFEVPGVMPNPRTEKVYEGIAICRSEKIDLVLAVGGGSVIDCSKMIAAGALLDGDFWEELFLNGKSLERSLPLGVILTMPATASEMNGTAVISHWEGNRKLGYADPLLHPYFSILDPVLTMTMPREQVVFGAVDMMSHVFEQYFSPPDDNNLTDELAEGLLRNIRLNLDASLADLRDYQARSNLMWDGTMALNGLLRLGKKGDWQAHKIEHALSAWYDIPHGAGLSIVHPNLLFYIRREAEAKLARYAEKVWGICPQDRTQEEMAFAGLKAMRAYFDSIGAPATLGEVGIPEEA
ncbi:MAG TPA: iron-containing alcohol dehydrogenase, partial [Bacillota bacterium]|nr:iron-containing alcohol dehydrogenase [Bacillota bacterium]